MRCPFIIILLFNITRLVKYIFLILGGKPLTGISKVLNAFLDLELMKDPVFLTIAFSNIIGFMGLYVPFVYIVEAATLDVSYSLKRIFLLYIFCYKKIKKFVKTHLF